MEDYLRAHVWEPAGMDATSFDVPTRIIPRRARGYEFDAASGELTNAVQEDVSYKYVGGGIARQRRGHGAPGASSARRTSARQTHEQLI